jgi:hypothetical protein
LFTNKRRRAPHHDTLDEMLFRMSTLHRVRDVFVVVGLRVLWFFLFFYFSSVFQFILLLYVHTANMHPCDMDKTSSSYIRV